MARQKQHSSDAPAAAMPPAQPRGVIPPPANDNRGGSAARVIAAFALVLVGLALLVLALQPFG